MPILPTPVVGVLGVIDDVTRRTPIGFSAEADSVVLLGETRDELAGSAWAEVAHDHLGGRPPVVDLDHERRLAGMLLRGSRRGLLHSAHDLAEGGLAQALFESCVRRGFGVQVTLPERTDPFVALFSESSGRVLVSLPADAEADLRTLCAEAEITLTRLGTVTGPVDAQVAVEDQFTLPLARLAEAWRATLPAAMGRG